MYYDSYVSVKTRKFSKCKLIIMTNIAPLLTSILCIIMQTVGVVAVEETSTFSNVKDSSEYFDKDCIPMDGLCLLSWEVANYRAIRFLHAQLDDDHNGDVNVSESVEFLKEELSYTHGFASRQQVFHHNDDLYISVPELWRQWFHSEVYNWTSDETVMWLHTNVELSQYVNVFIENAVNGSMLPRLAMNSDHFLSHILGIKDPVHRSKISVKAMDVVLFGTPGAHYGKDFMIALLICLLVVGSYNFYQLQKAYKHQKTLVNKYRPEIENLEVDVQKLPAEVHIFSESPESVPPTEHDQQDDAENASDSEELKLLLQCTFEKETLFYQYLSDRIKVDLKSIQIKSKKLTSRKFHIFAALAFIHGRHKYEPRTEVLREDLHNRNKMIEEAECRWKQIEKYSGFDIIGHGDTFKAL